MWIFKRNQILVLAMECGILQMLSTIVEKRKNNVHTVFQTMKSLFTGFIYRLRIHKFPLCGFKEHIATDYRDLRRCTRASYMKAKKIMEDFYFRIRKIKRIKITIDGTFIGVWGKTYEHASKMYSGNKKDRGKAGYTIVTCFDTTNKLPMSFEVPIIHELHGCLPLIKKVISWEKEGLIAVDTIILDALYLNKKILNLLSGHRFIIRAPARKWLVRFIPHTSAKGYKEIELWGHKVTLHWKPSKDRDEKYMLLITNCNYHDIWRVYGHNKQMIENYHDDLKNELGIRNLPSRKFYPIVVYFTIIILIYMLARALLLGMNMHRISCGRILVIINHVASLKDAIVALKRAGTKLSKTAESILARG